MTALLVARDEEPADDRTNVVPVDLVTASVVEEAALVSGHEFLPELEHNLRICLGRTSTRDAAVQDVPLCIRQADSTIGVTTRSSSLLYGRFAFEARPSLEFYVSHSFVC